MPITSERNFYNIHHFLDLTNLKLEKRYLKFLNIFLGKEPVPPPKKKKNMNQVPSTYTQQLCAPMFHVYLMVAEKIQALAVIRNTTRVIQFLVINFPTPI